MNADVATSQPALAYTRPAHRRTALLRIEPRGPFSLAAAAAFSCRFAPASGRMAASAGVLRMAFALDGSFEPVGVSVHQRGDAVDVHMDLGSGADPSVVTAQVARILSLDHDGAGYPDVASRDPVIGRWLREIDFLRPVCFGSPYEAAAWGILAQRLPMQQAARVQQRLASELGGEVEVDGERLVAFPKPDRIVGLQSFPGLASEKVVRLRGIAEAALAGRLDAARLRAMPFDRALAELRSLRGIGEWTAAHVLLRGAGVADEPAFGEPRVVRGFALLHGRQRLPSERELAAAAEAWRPYRTWVSVALAVHLAREGQWSAARSDRRGRRSTDQREPSNRRR